MDTDDPPRDDDALVDNPETRPALLFPGAAPSLSEREMEAYENAAFLREGRY